MTVKYIKKSDNVANMFIGLMIFQVSWGLYLAFDIRKYLINFSR